MNYNINRVKIVTTIPTENVEEVKLETVCEVKNVKKVISKLREVHPYEEPAIDIVPLLDEENFD